MGSSNEEKMSRTDKCGRAYAGSQLQIQIYVNRRQQGLAEAIVAAFPDLTSLNPFIRWVSPLESEGFAEYQDEAFLHALGLEHLWPALRQLWPKGGPCWDALATVEVPGSQQPHGIILLEAKSYPEEMYGSGCKAASERSIKQIQNALNVTKRWLGSELGADWIGPLYQSANRLAHLYFFLEKAKIPAWLVNVCFIDDRACASPTSKDEWQAVLLRVKSELGLNRSTTPNCAHILLEARDRG